MNAFYTLLNAFINTLEATTTETKDRKNRIMNVVKQLYNKYLNTYKRNFRGRDYKQFEIIDKKKQKSEWIEEKTKRDAKTIMA